MTDKMEEESCSTGIRIKSYIGPSVSNVIMLMTIGLRYDFDHPIRQTIDKIFLADRSNDFVNFFSIPSHFVDLVRFLISLIPDFVIPDMKLFTNYVSELTAKVTRERMVVIDGMTDYELSEQGDCFIDSYLKHMKIRQKSETDETNENMYFTGIVKNWNRFCSYY